MTLFNEFTLSKQATVAIIKYIGEAVASPSLTCHGGQITVPRSLLIVDDSKSVRDAVQKALIDTGLFSDLFYAGKK